MSKFSKQTQIFREQYLTEKIAASSSLHIGSAHKNTHSRVTSCFCEDHHSCIIITDPLTGKRELRAHRCVAVTEKRDGLNRHSRFYKSKIPPRSKDLMATCTRTVSEERPTQNCLFSICF